MRKRRQQREELQAQMMAARAEARRITPMDIQQKEFRLALRGYNERDVDEFLDAITEEMARLITDNSRLRDELEIRDREARAAQAEAEATIRRARQEAARMLGEAEAQARGIQSVEEPAEPIDATPTVGSFLKKNSMVQAIRPFLGREREFLQSMARLIQEHADSVRDEVRQIREVPPDGTASDVEQVAEQDRSLPGESDGVFARRRDTDPAQAERPAVEPDEPLIRPRNRREPKETAESRVEPQVERVERVAPARPRPETPQPPPPRRGRKGEDGGRGAQRRQAPVAAQMQGGTESSSRSSWEVTPESLTEDVFQPKRRKARPPVGRVEREPRPREEPNPRRKPAPAPDMPLTEPFDPLQFDEGIPPSLEPHEEGQEDERSLRELFWGEE
ncbi:MAG TPA: DivIVA domain-containing protein [Actinomycetota bacterium]